MGVVIGAVGKSPAIEKANRLLQENGKRSNSEYMERQFVGTVQEMRKHYPPISIDLSFVRGEGNEDKSV